MASTSNPRDSWRISVEKGGLPGRNASAVSGFDEIVVGNWLHIERMNTGEWWIRLGERTGTILVQRNGKAKVCWHVPELPAAPAHKPGQG